MMLKQFLLILMLIGLSHIRLYAQNWSEKDSVWLSGILTGKDTIRINPEFQKAISSGTFIHLEDEPGQQILEAPAELPILKDFSEYLHVDSDSVYKKLDYKSIPPSVYRLYAIELDTGFKIKKEVYTSPSISFLERKEVKVGKLPIVMAAGGRNLYDTDIVKDGQKRGTITGSAKFYFSLDDLLKWVFSKKERNKIRNRKRKQTLLDLQNHK